jgi:hypothetical protein
MSDRSVSERIELLVAEEHDLRGRGDNDRLREVEVELDRCWDLLRQRRAREEFGLDPDDASVRPADTVEGYEQ